MTAAQLINILEQVEPDMEIVLPDKDNWQEITNQIQAAFYSYKGLTYLLISQKIMTEKSFRA